MAKQERTPVKGQPGFYAYLKYGRKHYGFVADVGVGRRHQVTRQGFTSLEAARKERTALQHGRHTGEVMEASRELLRDFTARWLAAKRIEVRGSTMISYGVILKRIERSLGDTPIGAIRAQDVQAMVTAWVAKGYKSRTIKDSVTVLRKVFETAVAWRLVRTSPVTHIALPRAEEKRPPVVLTLDQLGALDTAAQGDPVWGVAIAVLIETWMRKGELLDLRWGAVDLERELIRVERTTSRNADGQRQTGPPKTATSRRVLAISPELATALRAWRDQSRFAGRIGDDALVFPHPLTGAWRSPHALDGALARLCVKAGVPVVTPHVLRHSGISAARLEGKDMVTISMRAGHKGLAMTLGVYSHTLAEEQERLGREFGALLHVG